MTIPKEVYQEWEKIYTHGDFSRMAEETGLSRPTISIAWNTKEASEDVLKAMNSFFADKKRRMETFTQDLVSDLAE